jgi:hypothetical protein
MFHLKLIKALSYTGVITATSRNPDVFTEDKATADAAVATGYFKLIEEQEEQQAKTAHLDKEQLESMKLDDLKKLAADMGIETKGLKSKAEFAEAIAAVEVIPGPETDEDGEENEVDYGEGSPTMVELQEK